MKIYILTFTWIFKNIVYTSILTLKWKSRFLILPLTSTIASSFWLNLKLAQLSPSLFIDNFSKITSPCGCWHYIASSGPPKIGSILGGPAKPKWMATPHQENSKGWSPPTEDSRHPQRKVTNYKNIYEVIFVIRLLKNVQIFYLRLTRRNPQTKV